MIAYDSTAGVYEVYSDTNATTWLGAYEEYRDAAECLRRYLAA